MDIQAISRKTKYIDDALTEAPKRVGVVLIAFVTLIWIAVGSVGVVTYMAWEDAVEIRRNLAEAVSQTPSVPRVEYEEVAQTQLKFWIDGISSQYPGLSISVNGRGAIRVEASSLASFDLLQRFIQHVTYGMNPNHVRAVSKRSDVRNMCVGMDCSGSPLSVDLLIKEVKITNPSS